MLPAPASVLNNRVEGINISIAEQTCILFRGYASQFNTKSRDWGYATHLQKEALLLGSWNLTSLAVCPLAAGDAVLRDMRLWHGGTPNRRNRSRYLPSAEFLSTWYASITIQVPEDHFSPRPALPFAHWLGLSANAQRRTQFILAAPEPVRAKVREDFVLMLPYVAEERP
ncbi:unnamed protein product [Symbiodinium sp. CCMP2592]|nr:unnamed protein product [Symbiodinium sp. CCMP2592]